MQLAVVSVLHTVPFAAGCGVLHVSFTPEHVAACKQSVILGVKHIVVLGAGVPMIHVPDWHLSPAG